VNINICVNGTFRYPQYIREYARAGALNKYYFSHRLGTNAKSLGIRRDQSDNIWFKEYALHAGLRILRSNRENDLMVTLGDLWQAAVIAKWNDCHSVEAVIGQIADRVLTHAKRRGTATLGHPVNSHPATFASLLNEEHYLLGIPPPAFRVSERRLVEIDTCDRLLVDSGFVQQSFIDNKFPVDRIHVVRPGGDLSRFYARGEQDVDREVFRVVSVGAITPRKGHRYLLEAWSQLRLRNAELVIVGPATEFSARIWRGFEGTFRHIDRIPNDQLRPLLASASMFVLPSIEDGYSQSPIEALCVGVPVVVTSNNGSADAIIDGVNGFVVPPRSPSRIAEVIQKLYDSRSLAAELGRNAAMGAARSFNWTEYVRQVLEIHARLEHQSPIVKSGSISQ